MVKRCASSKVWAFTLVEVLIAGGVTLLLAGVLFAVVTQSAESVSAARSNADEFQQAQRAFDTLTFRIGQATLNNYRDSIIVNNRIQPYQRMSELRFICGPMQCGTNPLDGKSVKERPGHGIFFQATSGRPGVLLDPTLIGLENLVNTWGYFVEVGAEIMPPPSFLPPETARRIAPRLMELREPAERLSIYGYTSGKPDFGSPDKPKTILDYTGFEWFRDPLAQPGLLQELAENIALLLVVPKLTPQETGRLAPGATVEQRDALLAPHLFYHSGALPPPGTPPARNMHHRLPATVELTMVALDGATVARLYGRDALDPFNLRDAFHEALDLRRELQIDPAQPEADSLERRLIAAHAHYRLFTTVVPIRAAQ